MQACHCKFTGSDVGHATSSSDGFEVARPATVGPIGSQSRPPKLRHLRLIFYDQNSTESDIGYISSSLKGLSGAHKADCGTDLILLLVKFYSHLAVLNTLKYFKMIGAGLSDYCAFALVLFVYIDSHYLF